MEGNTVAFIRIIVSFLAAFLLTLISVPRLIPVLHRLKFGQVEREEGLASHKKKNGTPTMGGLAFIVATLVAVLVGNYRNVFDQTVLLIALGFAGMDLIGLVDD